MGRERVRMNADEKKGSASQYFCYILECSDGTFYTGWTTDPERRARQHNNGTGALYTRTRRPVRIMYLERQPDRVAAMKRERAIKSLSREKKKKLVEQGKVSL